MYLGLWRSAQASYLEATWILLEPSALDLPQEIDHFKQASSVGGWGKHTDFHHFLVPASRANPRHGNDVKAGVLQQLPLGQQV